METESTRATTARIVLVRTTTPTAVRAAGPRIYSLEVGDEEEIDSLMKETDGLVDETILPRTAAKSNLSSMLQRNFNFRHRAAAVKHKHSDEQAESVFSSSRIQGLLRSGIGHASACRHVLLLCFLAASSVLLLHVLGGSGFFSRDVAAPKLKPPHAPSLGGHLNSGHYLPPSTNTDDYGDTWDDDFYTFGEEEDDDSSMRMTTVPTSSHKMQRSPNPTWA